MPNVIYQNPLTVDLVLDSVNLGGSPEVHREIIVLGDSTGNAVTSTGGALDVNLKTSGITVNVAFPVAQHIIVDSGLLAATQSGIWTVGISAAQTIAVTQAVAANLNATVVFPSAQHVIVDSASLGTVTISGTVTANQGTANATPWNENVAQFGGSAVVTGTGVGGAGIPRVTVSNDSALQIWDGTTVVSVEPGSEAAAAGDAALVVALSPNSPLPAGTNVLGTVTATQGTNPWIISGAITTTPGVTLAQNAGVTVSVAADSLGKLQISDQGGLGEVTQQMLAELQNIALSVDDSGVFQVGLAGLYGAQLDFSGQNATSPSSAILTGGQYNPISTALSPGNASPLQIDALGSLKVVGAGVVSVFNSSTIPLTANTVFQGTFEEVKNFGGLAFIAFSDQSSAINGLSFDWSSDGVNVDRSEVSNLIGGIGRAFNISNRARYFRVTYTNGSVAQTTFRMQTTYLVTAAGIITKPLSSTVNDGNFAQLEQAIVAGRFSTGTYSNITATNVSTAAQAGDVGLVVSLSPNSPISGLNGSNVVAVSVDSLGKLQVSDQGGIGDIAQQILVELQNLNTTVDDSGVFQIGLAGLYGAQLDFSGQNASSPSAAILHGGQYNATPTTISSGNASPLQLDATGNLKVNVNAQSLGTVAVTQFLTYNIGITSGGILTQTAVASASITQNQIILRDSNGILWALTVDNAGILHTTSTGSGSFTTLFLNDPANTTSWQVTVSTLGLLVTTSVSLNLTYPTTLTLNASAITNSNFTQLNGITLGSPSAFATSPGAVNVSGVNASLFAGTTNLVADASGNLKVNLATQTGNVNVNLAAQSNIPILVGGYSGLTPTTVQVDSIGNLKVSDQIGQGEVMQNILLEMRAMKTAIIAGFQLLPEDYSSGRYQDIYLNTTRL